MVFMLSVRLAAAIHDSLGRYAPTNILLDLLRSRRGLEWAVPAALLAVPAYLFAMSLCATIAEDGGPGWLNLLVILFFWNALKFVSMAVLSVSMLTLRALRRPRPAEVGCLDTPISSPRAFSAPGPP
jgi:hypothetical protein